MASKPKPKIGRPSRITEGKSISYYLDPDTIDRINRAAEKWGVSRSEALRQIIWEADIG